MKDKLVTIVLAMYKPNLIWLQELLISLNEQTYRNLELLVWNDSPQDDDQEGIFSKYITKFSYKIIHGEQNLGSNGAFAKLTQLAQGEYIAYCDQDDRWHADKIAILINKMTAESATLACSDMRLIDGKGRLLAERIIDKRPHQKFVEGKKQIETLLVRNFVTGCTMIVKSKSAQASLPFPKEMVHDHWLALWNALYGKIIIFQEPLVDYRLHGDNQTETLAGINTKEDYYRMKCLPYYSRMQMLHSRITNSNITQMIDDKFHWAELRVEYYQQPSLRKFFKLLAVLRNSISITGFELLLPIMPASIFKGIVKQIKQGNI